MAELAYFKSVMGASSMRFELRKKAIIVTALLSLALLGLGFEFGWLIASHQVDEANQLTSQATEKVLLLTQEKQELEKRQLQQAPLSLNQSEIWRQGNALYGVARQGHNLVFNEELDVRLLVDTAPHNQTDLVISWPGNQLQVTLATGEKFAINSNWQIFIAYASPGWAVIGLEPR